MTTLDAAWMSAYSRQADADFRAYELYARYPQAIACECHRLLFLQMACEKICKSYLICGRSDPQDLQSSHARIAVPLPRILNIRMMREGLNRRKIEGLTKKFGEIAREIELLNPAVERGGRRPENCEYPWAAGPRIVSPLDYEFEVSRLIVQEAGVTFLKMLRKAIDSLLRFNATSTHAITQGQIEEFHP